MTWIDYFMTQVKPTNPQICRSVLIRTRQMLSLPQVLISHKTEYITTFTYGLTLQQTVLFMMIKNLQCLSRGIDPCFVLCRNQELLCYIDQRHNVIITQRFRRLCERFSTQMDVIIRLDRSQTVASVVGSKTVIVICTYSYRRSFESRDTQVLRRWMTVVFGSSELLSLWKRITVFIPS